MEELFTGIIKFMAQCAAFGVAFYGFLFLTNQSDRKTFFNKAKLILKLFFKACIFIGIFTVAFYSFDYLSLIDLALYEKTGKMGLIGTISNNNFLLFVAVMLMFYFTFNLVNKLRIWKKFE